MKKLLILSIIILIQDNYGMTHFRKNANHVSSIQKRTLNVSNANAKQSNIDNLKSHNTDPIKNQEPDINYFDTNNCKFREKTKSSLSSTTYDPTFFNKMQNDYLRPISSTSGFYTQQKFMQVQNNNVESQNKYLSIKDLNFINRNSAQINFTQPSYNNQLESYDMFSMGDFSMSPPSPAFFPCPIQSENNNENFETTPSLSGYFSSDEKPTHHYDINYPDFRRRNSTQINPTPCQNTDSQLFKQKLEFYNKFPKQEFDDSDINYDGWKECPKDFYVTLLLGRHVRDADNMAQTAHSSESNSEINLDTVGVDKALALMTLGNMFKFDIIAGGTSSRHKTTARLISSHTADNQKCYYMEAFDEQKLGRLGGKHEKEILENPEFIKMFNDPNYKMKTPDQKIDKNSESGSEVITRFTKGIEILIDEVKQSRKANLGIDQEDLPFNSMFMYICTSRCTLNWMLKYFMREVNLPLQLKTIKNCNLFCINYYPNTGEFNVLKNTENMPYCISPLHFSYFALKSPVFHQFNLGFRQKVSRIIKNQDNDQKDDKELVRTTYLKVLLNSFETKKTKKEHPRSNTN